MQDTLDGLKNNESLHIPVVTLPELTWRYYPVWFMYSKINDIQYEPVLDAEEFEGLRVFKDFDAFKSKADVIVANRMSEELKDVEEKVYTRDVFSRD